MGSEWKELKLKDFVSLQRGHDLPTSKRGNGTVPIMGSFGITGYHDRAKTIGPGVTIGRSGGSMGVVNYINEDYWPLNTVLYITNFKGNDPFFTYLFLSEIDFTIYNSGSAQPSLNRNIIYGLDLNVPFLEEQTSIAKIIRSLDDKIELNRQMNYTLEEMAQALFKSWFVDFDPVIDNALATGSEIPEPLQQRAQQRQMLGEKRKLLPPEIQQLFSASFTYSEELDKWVPEGWRAGQIKDVAEVVGGGTPSTKVDDYFCENGIAWLSPKDLSGYEWKFISKGAKDITQLGLKNSSARLMPTGTVLFSSRAPIGYVAIAENEITTNQGFKSLVPKNEICSDYLYYFLKLNIENIEAIATGSTFKEVSGNAMKTFEILIPPANILDVYQQKTIDFNSKSLIIQKEVQSLTKLRNTLLPKLVSGEVRVSNSIF